LAKVTSAEGSYGVITERGFCYSTTSQNPTIYDSTIVVDGLQLNEVFEATITGLDQMTTYYVRPYAKNLVNWTERVGYGTAIEFTTTDFTSPQVSFTNQSEVKVTTSSIHVQAQIDNYYPTALVERGFIWSTDDKNISIDNAKSVGNYLTVSSNDKVFSGTISSLDPNTNYYIRAYAIYQASGETLTGLSEVVSYTTDDVASGSFKNITCTDKTTTSLTLNTGVSDLGDGVLTEIGFVWRAGSGVAVTLDKCDGSQIVQSENYYDYSATIIGLQQATGYTVRGYVKTTYNWQTYIAYSDALYCETNDFTAATVKDITCTAQTISSLTVESGITDMGNGTLVEKGFIYKAGNNGTPTLESNDGLSKVEGTAQGAYSATITGLTYSTEYRVRSYVKTTLDGKTQVSYSNILTATTSDLTGVTFKASSCTAKTTSSLTIEGGITDLGDGEITEKGFLWRVSDGITPTLDNCDGSQASSDTSNDSFSYTISGLQSGSSYNVRPYVKTTYNWETFVSYGDVITCETNTFTSATMKEITCTAQTISTLTVESGISESGNGTLVEKGFIYKAGNSGMPTLESNEGISKVEGGSQSNFSATITGLNYSTEYRVRSYVKTTLDGMTQVAYSGTITATTSDLNYTTFKNLTCSSVTTSSITLATGITDQGDGELTETGFVWRIGQGVSPTIDNYDGTLVVTGTSYDSYTAVISGLEAATTYTIRAYTKSTYNWETIVTYSDAIVSQTNDFTAATMKAISCTTQTTTTLTVESGITDMGNGEFVEKGFLWRSGSSGTPTLENCDGSLKVDGTDRSSYSATITGLQVGTSYRLRGYIKTIQEGTIILSYTDVITASTNDKVAATMKSTTTSLDDDCIIGMSGGINSLGTGELVEKGFCWKIDGTPTLEDCDGYKAVSGGSDESYSVSIDELHYNSTYYIRSYAKTEIDGEILVSYSSYSTCTTSSIIYYSTKTGEDYIEISMSCNDSYTDKMTEWSAAIVKEGDNEVTLDDNSYTSATKDSSTNEYVAKLTGLKSNTTYVIRMRAKYNDDYYIYQNTLKINSRKGPSKGDIDNPVIK
jgi:metal-dependent HD superfamily phosphatase/phosphodiesterase